MSQPVPHQKPSPPTANAASIANVPAKAARSQLQAKKKNNPFAKQQKKPALVKSVFSHRLSSLLSDIKVSPYYETAYYAFDIPVLAANLFSFSEFMSTEANRHEEVYCGLVLGGIVYQLVRKLHFVGLGTHQLPATLRRQLPPGYLELLPVQWANYIDQYGKFEDPELHTHIAPKVTENLLGSLYALSLALGKCTTFAKIQEVLDPEKLYGWIGCVYGPETNFQCALHSKAREEGIPYLWIDVGDVEADSFSYHIFRSCLKLKESNGWVQFDEQKDLPVKALVGDIVQVSREFVVNRENEWLFIRVTLDDLGDEKVDFAAFEDKVNKAMHDYSECARNIISLSRQLELLRPFVASDNNGVSEPAKQKQRQLLGLQKELQNYLNAMRGQPLWYTSRRYGISFMPFSVDSIVELGPHHKMAKAVSLTTKTFTCRKLVLNIDGTSSPTMSTVSRGLATSVSSLVKAQGSEYLWGILLGPTVTLLLTEEGRLMNAVYPGQECRFQVNKIPATREGILIDLCTANRA